MHRELWSNSSRLTTLASTKNIHGVPINVPFTDLTDLAFTLESTHVHENEDEKTKVSNIVLDWSWVDLGSFGGPSWGHVWQFYFEMFSIS